MGEVKIDGAVFPHSMSASALKAARKTIEQARISTKSLMEKLQKSIASRDAIAQKGILAALPSNKDILLTCAVAANKTLKPKKRQPLESCLEVANSLSFDKPLSEIVPVYPKPKSGGGVRMIHDHGLHHRTGQKLVQLFLSPFFKPRSFQYTYKGVHAAVSEVRKRLQMGYVYIGRYDIKSFYGSFHDRKLSSTLPVPQGLVDYVAVGRHMKVKMKSVNRWGDNVSPSIASLSFGDLLSAACRGIPHGSTCSPLVSSYCMSQLRWPAMPELVLVNYADDFLLMGRSMQLLQKAGQVLVAAVGNLPGGQFELVCKCTGEAKDGFSFLGHQFRSEGGCFKVRPTERNLEHFWKKFLDLDQHVWPYVYPVNLSKKDAFPLAVEGLARLAAFVQGWRAAFSACDDPDRWIGDAPKQIGEYRKALGISSHELEASIDPSMIVPDEFYFSGG